MTLLQMFVALSSETKYFTCARVHKVACFKAKAVSKEICRTRHPKTQPKSCLNVPKLVQKQPSDTIRVFTLRARDVQNPELFGNS